MGTKASVGVIGLGKFGLHFAETLVDLGHEVMGIDRDGKLVREARSALTQVYEADASDKDVLVQLEVQKLDYVLVSVGSSIATSVMIGMYLKEIGVKTVLAKAVHRDHQKLLRKVGVDKVVIPEIMAAREVAARIAMPGFVEHLPFDTTMGVRELNVSAWAGKTLRQLNLSNRLAVQVVAVKRKGEEYYSYIPGPDAPLSEGDDLVVIGKLTELGKLES